MQTEQRQWVLGKWTPSGPGKMADSAQLVLAFGGPTAIKNPELIAQLGKDYPSAQIVGCTTAGEICDTRVSDDTLVATALRFDHTQIKAVTATVYKPAESESAGESLGRSLSKEGLRHVLVFSDGLNVNGSALVKGLAKQLPKEVSVTGGMAGDGARFGETFVLWNGKPQTNTIVVVGLYGDKLKVGFGSVGGWDSFGPQRLITRAQGNVLYELDRQSALSLYKSYLGKHAEGLPSTGLLFPLCLSKQGEETGVVRTILAVDEKEQTMTFAGDMPVGSYARLMRANFDRLIDGAVNAAKMTHMSLKEAEPNFALLISCVGRKLILKQRIEEETEAVREVVGPHATIAGFYSYGEIAPFKQSAKCELHNQTMTITTFREE